MTLVRSLHAFVSRVAPGLLSWPRVAAALLIVAVSSVYWAAPLRTIFTPTGDLLRQTREHFNNGAVETKTPLEITGYFAGTDGWYLMPKASGSLTYRFVAEDDGFPSLALWYYLPAGGTNRLAVSVDGKSPQVISQNVDNSARWVNLGIRVSRGQTVALIFDATNPSPNQALVLDQLLVEYRTATMPSFPRDQTVFLIVLSFGLAVTVLCRNWPLALTTTLIIAVAVHLRYERAANLLFQALEPDAFMYRKWADSMRLFSDTGFFSAQFGVREPGYIFAIHVYNSVFGSSDFGLRLLCVLLTPAYIWGTIRVVRKLWGVVAGQIAGLLMAVNVPLVMEAGRGLRLELELVFCLAFFYLAFARDWSRRWVWETVAIAIVGAVLVMTRSTYVPIILVLAAYAVYRRVGWKAAIGGALITAAILAAVVVPHRYSMYKLHNDAYFDTNAYARYNANFEFAGRPGFPTVEQLQADGFIGPGITYSEYMLGMHTKWELVEGTARGYWKLYRHMEISPWWVENKTTIFVLNVIFQVLGAAGMLVALWKWEYLWIPFGFVVFEFPVSFLYDRNMVELYRHSYTSFPLVLFAAILFVHRYARIR
jgi:hypothetical protein